ncbi:MAG: sigma-70 family RNA polymerase sigma factor [Kiritimatiellae bacterium]|nr:sigma-70 family RNA polymerase sigma factor [Kiritimatiellia bacterium]
MDDRKKAAGAAPVTSVTLLKTLGEDSLSPRWTEFAEKYASTVKGFLLKYFPTVDADEVFNDTLVTLVEKLPVYSYDPDAKGHFRNYLVGIVRYKAIEQLKKRSRYEEVKGSLAAEKELSWIGGDGPCRADLSNWRRDAYESALQQFMADKSVMRRDKEIFRRIVLREESPASVAEIFGITRNNVDQIKSRMVKKLKALALSYASVCGGADGLAQ